MSEEEEEEVEEIEGSSFAVAKRVRVEDLIEAYDGIMNDVDEVLREAQISGPLPKPAMPEGLEGIIQWTPDYGDPGMPDDLTTLEGSELGKLFSFIQNWTNYVASELTRAQCCVLAQSKHLKKLHSHLASYYREDEDRPSTLIKDYVSSDTRYDTVECALTRMEVYAKTVAGRHQQYKGCINAISREQTRRKEEWEREVHDTHGGRGGPESDRARGQGFRRS